MQIELEQTGTEDGWNESWRRGRRGVGLDGGRGEGRRWQSLELQQQITNIRQVFLNSGAAAQPFSLSLVLYGTSGYLGSEYAARRVTTNQRRSNSDSRASVGTAGSVKAATHQTDNTVDRR